MLSPVSIPCGERKWTDVEPGKFSQGCFEVSNFMIRLLRHDDTLHREDDGAVRFDDLAELFKLRLQVLRTCKSSLDQLPGKRRRTEEKVAWTPILPNISCISEQSRDIQEVLSLILHCKTMYCYRMSSPITSTTSGTLTTCTPSSRVDWFREEEVSKGTGSPCFSQPRIRCTPIKIWKKFNTIWTNPKSRCTQIRWEFTKIQYIGAIWSSLREKDCSSIKTIARNGSFQHFACDMYWENGLHEDWRGFFYCKYTNSQG